MTKYLKRLYTANKRKFRRTWLLCLNDAYYIYTARQGEISYCNCVESFLVSMNPLDKYHCYCRILIRYYLQCFTIFWSCQHVVLAKKHVKLSILCLCYTLLLGWWISFISFSNIILPSFRFVDDTSSIFLFPLKEKHLTYFLWFLVHGLSIY